MSDDTDKAKDLATDEKVTGFDSARMEEKTEELVDHPSHYGGDTTYEAIKVIEAWGLGFNLGNAVKYICRAGSKDDPLLDLKKALWYLVREVEGKLEGKMKGWREANPKEAKHGKS